MVTRLIQRYQTQDISIPFKFAILIGGPCPKEYDDTHENLIDISSLHIYGTSDSILEKCKALTRIYKNSTILEHNEGHNIPSVSTNTYESIKKFIYDQSFH